MSKGLAPLMILLIIALLIVGASAASYYVLKFAGGETTYNYPTPTASSSGENLEKELNDASVDLPETEFSDLESEASSL